MPRSLQRWLRGDSARASFPTPGFFPTRSPSVSSRSQPGQDAYARHALARQEADNYWNQRAAGYNVGDDMQPLRPPSPLIFVFLAAPGGAAMPEALCAESATHRVERTMEDGMPTVFRIEPSVSGLEY